MTVIIATALIFAGVSYALWIRGQKMKSLIPGAIAATLVYQNVPQGTKIIDSVSRMFVGIIANGNLLAATTSLVALVMAIWGIRVMLLGFNNPFKSH